jgi:hypothetical protein
MASTMVQVNVRLAPEQYSELMQVVTNRTASGTVTTLTDVVREAVAAYIDRGEKTK